MHRRAGTLSIVCLVVIGMAVASMPLFAQRASAQAVTWARTYGGADEEYAYSIQQTSDGGYVVTGETSTFGVNAGQDVWVLKLDSLGAIQWEKTYGNGEDEVAQMIRQTSDGGYVVAGLTDAIGSAWWDAWVLKLDSGGNVEWQKSYGTPKEDYVRAIWQTTDGGYVFVGSTDYFRKGLYGDAGDIWIVRLDPTGNMVWQKTYNLGVEWGVSIQQTSDGGYIVGGDISYSAGTKKNPVSYDGFFLMKLDASGGVTWQKSYGGSVGSPYGVQYDAPEVKEVPGGGYIVVGTFLLNSNYDFWIFKVDSTGGMIWQERIDRGPGELGRSVTLASDGGYVVVGRSDSGTYADIWVVKLDGGGAIQWQKTYGGAAIDSVYDMSTVQQTSDGGYVVGGTTNSYGAGARDFWVLKLDENGNIGGCTVPGCGVDTYATLVPSSVTPKVIPPMTLRSLPTVVTNTAATVMNSAATVNIQCTG